MHSAYSVAFPLPLKKGGEKKKRNLRDRVMDQDQQVYLLTLLQAGTQ